ncbi:ATP-binding protein [Flavobacterium granuli]|uniref:Histidine kinase-, DNA gyrase B-, and HSP90-like ATPase n=1 Tax=Flavobacterium granuli TaxID=280093 RepID=A0A1M5RKX8_9FLAO|nr:ATP-binding protein [Flavobacterium granuli]PRZ22837.1 histidine kinase/DNA gyrase B/HSP90-like ATPase [Flavobacterium granuli]SHH26766.1 Histidine kinase-, DNA gyrase B-, and HSP90-like ATPase [Flavobacterium granuli]
MNESEISFEVKSGMKNIIGRDLIIDDNIAIFELVKNSYDAHAKNVIITFEDDKIVISDNGKGMSEYDLVNKWFAVAYSAKHDGTEDDDVRKDSHLNNLKSKRFYAGAKGIGRFSCDRLGGDLILTTSKLNETEISQVNVDWHKFEINAKENFQNIKIPFQTLNSYKLNFPNNSQHGTILEITKLSTIWDANKIRNLKFSLEKLINPFSKNEEFSIQIICKKYEKNDIGLNERQKINGQVNNSILDILDLKTTQLDLVIDNNLITTKLIDRGTLIYHIEEPNIYFSLITDLRINLYFLNRSAKIHFGKLMDIEPVNYGNVFLFKNGFRVQPYGNTNDDSWGLDNRKQQGYNRFLGTRDLFGRVDIITENFNEFKEVSSRDGGLVETFGYNKLMEAFWEKSLKRLERYVVGVLWGEAFLRKKYFKTENEGQQLRAKLDKDKDSEDYSTAVSNLGSKLDFVNLIKSLSDDDNIKIIDYDKKLVDFVNEQLDVVQPKFLKDLEKIAEKTNDSSLLSQVKITEENFKKLELEKETAEKRALEEEKRRIEAENRAKEAEKRRLEAEQKAQDEERKRKEAELATERKEKERLQAELNKIKAEQKAKEEEERRKLAEITADNRKQQVDRFRSSESIEYKDLRDSNHIIGVYSDDISKKIQLFKRKLDKTQNLKKEEIISFLQGISLANEKISTITRFTTKSNFLEASLSLKEDIVSYIKNYLLNIYGLLHKDIQIDIMDNEIEFIRDFQPIELCVAIDNILSNSRRKDAKKIIFEFEKLNENLFLSIKDIGKSLDSNIDSKLIFEEGITSTKGAGLGLNHVKRIMEKDLNAEIEYNPNYKEGFELKILFKK